MNRRFQLSRVYIGLGSNMGSPGQHLNAAITSLNQIPMTKMITVSSLYKSKPLGPQDQDDYINAVAEIETRLDALSLLDHLQTIENEHGRVRTRRWGPRTLDLDILMYGNDRIQNERLNIPHVEMLNRAFVLLPLAEINPDCIIPDAGPLKTHLEQLEQSGLERLP